MTDFILHFLVSVWLYETLIVFKLFVNEENRKDNYLYYITAVDVVIIGIAKEVLDIGLGGFNKVNMLIDMSGNILGILVGFILMMVLLNER